MTISHHFNILTLLLQMMVKLPENEKKNHEFFVLIIFTAIAKDFGFYHYAGFQNMMFSSMMIMKDRLHFNFPSKLKKIHHFRYYSQNCENYLSHSPKVIIIWLSHNDTELTCISSILNIWLFFMTHDQFHIVVKPSWRGTYID